MRNDQDFSYHGSKMYTFPIFHIVNTSLMDTLGPIDFYVTICLLMKGSIETSEAMLHKDPPLNLFDIQNSHYTKEV